MILNKNKYKIYKIITNQIYINHFLRFKLCHFNNLMQRMVDNLPCLD